MLCPRLNAFFLLCPVKTQLDGQHSGKSVIARAGENLSSQVPMNVRKSCVFEEPFFHGLG